MHFFLYTFKNIGRKGKNTINRLKSQVRCNINKYFKRKALLKKTKLHIGCGEIYLNNFINVDYRPTRAADITIDCTSLTYFPQNSIDFIYANAFLEHIYILKRLSVLKSCYSILKENGVILFTGIPDFFQVAKAYLARKKGIIGKVFDTNEVYLFTHGNPEQSPDWWLEQLHKSLFDKRTLQNLLEMTGFYYYCIFNYTVNKNTLPIDMGFIAFKKKPSKKITISEITKFLKKYNKAVNLKTIKIIYQS